MFRPFLWAIIRHTNTQLKYMYVHKFTNLNQVHSDVALHLLVLWQFLNQKNSDFHDRDIKTVKDIKIKNKSFIYPGFYFLAVIPSLGVTV